MLAGSEVFFQARNAPFPPFQFYNGRELKYFNTPLTVRVTTNFFSSILISPQCVPIMTTTAAVCNRRISSAFLVQVLTNHLWFSNWHVYMIEAWPRGSKPGQIRLLYYCCVLLNETGEEAWIFSWSNFVCTLDDDPCPMAEHCLSGIYARRIVSQSWTAPLRLLSSTQSHRSIRSEIRQT